MSNKKHPLDIVSEKRITAGGEIYNLPGKPAHWHNIHGPAYIVREGGSYYYIDNVFCEKEEWEKKVAEIKNYTGTDEPRAKRFNKDKVDYTLLPVAAAEEECRVWMSGTEKYGRDNWQKLWGEETINIALASLLRHAFLISAGELFDKESGFSHAAHIRCNAAMIIEHMRRENLINK